MKYTQYMPLLLIFINIIAAALYAYDGDYRKVIYWLSAACLTASITF